jgi:GNAT superfamily N-acetyltransferase
MARAASDTKAKPVLQPLTPERWGDFVDLFGANGACGGCWCMWWRAHRPDFLKGRGAGNKQALKRIVDRGPPPGVLAYVDGKAVGWCAVAPRSEKPVLDNSRLAKRVDDKDVWSISCFFTRAGYRGRGLSKTLIEAALKLAKKQGAKLVEAYPWDTTEKKSTTTIYTGIASTFAALGFETVARRAPHRPVMRKPT